MDANELPKLIPVAQPSTDDRPPRKKKKILLLSDDMRMNSGIAVMSREIVLGTVDEYDWVQLGAAVKHPEQGKVVDLSEDARKISGVYDANVRMYPNDGYGNAQLLRELINREVPDAILHFTDPRYWQWLYEIEHEIRRLMPLVYYNIWDDAPTPLWNEPFYESCDMVLNISRQTHALVKGVLGQKGWDLDENEDTSRLAANDRRTFLAYVPHGINPDTFKPVNDADLITAARAKYWGDTDAEFIVFVNNRNIRRKNIPDIILAYAAFCDSLPKAEADLCLLAINTRAIEDAGTDLLAVVEAVCPHHKVAFTDNVPAVDLNLLYNAASVTVTLASNEGFGLTTAESLMACTPIIAPVTGGLQDQMRFEDENGNWIKHTPDFPSNHNGRYRKHGKWCVPIFPASRSLKGSPATPYIFDDTCHWEDMTAALRRVYEMSDVERVDMGNAGRAWMLSEESMMSSEKMAANFVSNLGFILDNWKPRKRFGLYKATNRGRRAQGILKNE